jgi:hypothetical protein
MLRRARLTYAHDYQFLPNIIYLTATSYAAKLDVYLRRSLTAPSETLIFINGRMDGTERSSVPCFL